MLSRRTLLRTTALALPATALFACSGVTLSQLAQDAATAANALQTAAAASPNLVSRDITSLLSTVSADATKLAAATSSTTASLASELVSAGEALLPMLAPLVAAIPGGALALAAAQVLLPVIASEAGITAVAAAQPTAAVAALPKMDLATARRMFGA